MADQSRAVRAGITQPVTLPAAGNTTIAEIEVAGFERLVIEVSTATQALDAFLVDFRVAGSSTFLNVFNAAGDFTSPAGLMIDASASPVALAAGNFVIFVLDVRGMGGVRLRASAAVDGAVVTVLASAA